MTLRLLESLDCWLYNQRVMKRRVPATTDKQIDAAEGSVCHDSLLRIIGAGATHTNDTGRKCHAQLHESRRQVEGARKMLVCVKKPF